MLRLIAKWVLIGALAYLVLFRTNETFDVVGNILGAVGDVLLKFAKAIAGAADNAAVITLHDAATTAAQLASAVLGG